MALRGIFSALSIGVDYRRLWLAQAFSSFGEYFFAGTSTVWVAVQLFPDSPSLPVLVGAVILAASIPRIVVGPLAGVYVDRRHPRTTMIVSGWVRAGLLASLLLIVQFGGLGSAQLFTVILSCVVVSETSAQFFNPARASIMQVVIPEDRRVDAASLSMFSLTGVAIAATAAGPAVFGLFGARAAISSCVAAYVLSGILTTRVCREHRPATGVSGRFWRDLSDGVRAAWRAPMLRVVLIGACFYGVSLGINSSVLALFGLKSLGLAPSHYGLLSMMFPLGNMISAALGVRFIEWAGVHRGYPVALSALGLGYFAYACAGRLVTACLLMLVCGVVFSIYVMCQGPILQDAVPEGYMGRISAVVGPLVSMTSAVSTLFVSQVLAFAGAHGVIAGDGSRYDPYRLLIMFGAAFLLVGGAGMYVVQVRARRKSQWSAAVG
ncbi:MFS transporter [Nocardia asteroides]|uniref:MFS transporter n=1 Tax=Nocardia asteroides TaxID=1824 RepID=UPI0033DAA7D3